MRATTMAGFGGIAAIALAGAVWLFPASGAASPSTASSMTVNGNAVNIATMSAKHELKFYWAVNGTNTWHPETIADPGSVG